MDRGDMTRILLEGALNGIGFVIGSALVGLVLSIFLIFAHHLITLIALPIIPAAHWKPTGNEDPSWRIQGMLAVTVGLPYFVLSTTSPLV